MNSTNLKRLRKRSKSAPARNDEDILSPKRGRPSRSSTSSSRPSRSLNKIEHKQKICMFKNLKCCVQNPDNLSCNDFDMDEKDDDDDDDDELVLVMSDARGMKLLSIK